HGGLADVVQPSARDAAPVGLLVEAQLVRDLAGQLRDEEAVTRRALPGVDGVRQILEIRDHAPAAERDEVAGLRLADLDAVAAALLRAVERRVRDADELLRTRSVRREA